MQIRILKWGAALLLLAAMWWGLDAWKKSKVEAPSFNTTTIERSDLRASVSASGTLSPVVNVSVGAQVSGRIEALYADYNDEVTEGQLLARIDQSVYRANVNQASARVQSATASLREAQASFELSEKTLRRMRELVGQDLIARAELDEAEASQLMAQARVMSARATLQEAQASLDNARANLEYTEIYSPVSGVVLSREIDVGQSVQASFEAPTLFQIAEDLSRMQVNTSVAEADISQLRTGMVARFTVDAYPQRTFTGTVREVRLAATTESNVVTYDAVVDVLNEDRALFPGMTATIDFIVEERPGALVLPNAALRFIPPEGTTCDQRAPEGEPGARTSSWRSVWRPTETGIECIFVRLGITDNGRSEIVEGPLNEGDAIVLSLANDDAGAPRGRPRVF